MANGLFDNLNSNAENLNFFVSDSAQEMLDLIKQVRLPMNIVSMYAVGTKHYCWFRTTAKIIKKTKKKET